MLSYIRLKVKKTLCYGNSKFIGDWPELDERMGYPKKWRYYRAYAKNNKWKYIEYTKYDYNAIEDSKLMGFEKYLALIKYGFPPERWEKEVKE